MKRRERPELIYSDVSCGTCRTGVPHIDKFFLEKKTNRAARMATISEAATYPLFSQTDDLQFSQKHEMWILFLSSETRLLVRARLRLVLQCSALKHFFDLT